MLNVLIGLMMFSYIIIIICLNYLFKCSIIYFKNGLMFSSPSEKNPLPNVIKNTFISH